MKDLFFKRLEELEKQYNDVVPRVNEEVKESNGVYVRFKYPVLTAQHAPITWRYDLNYETNPFLIERFGINAVMNAGAIKLNNKYCLVAGVEGIDRSLFLQ